LSLIRSARDSLLTISITKVAELPLSAPLLNLGEKDKSGDLDELGEIVKLAESELKKYSAMNVFSSNLPSGGMTISCRMSGWNREIFRITDQVTNATLIVL
jgi:hypothetical protein